MSRAWVDYPVSNGTVRVDRSDVPRIDAHRWFISGRNLDRSCWYAKGRVDGRFVLMHRFLLQAERGVCVDHINGDTLDNRRCNLRLATPALNGINRRKRVAGRSRFKGVSFDKRSPGKPYRAVLIQDGKWVLRSYHVTEVAAARAYDAAVRRLRGPVAPVNFPRRGELSAIACQDAA